jgi:hypothetical protein
MLLETWLAILISGQWFEAHTWNRQSGPGKKITLGQL